MEKQLMNLLSGLKIKFDFEQYPGRVFFFDEKVMVLDFRFCEKKMAINYKYFEEFEGAFIHANLAKAWMAECFEKWFNLKVEIVPHIIYDDCAINKHFKGENKRKKSPYAIKTPAHLLWR